MSEDDDFPDFFKEFSKLMFSPFDGLNQHNILHHSFDDSNGDDSNQSKPSMSLRDQLLIKPPPSTSGTNERTHPSYEEPPPSRNDDDSFQNNQPRGGSQFQNFPFFHNGGLHSMMDDFFGRQFDSPFTDRNLPLKIDERKDSDLDDDIRGEGLDAVLQRNQDDSFKEDDDSLWQTPQLRNKQQSSHFHGFHQTKSIIRRSDGSSEERIVKRDSDGKEEITTIIQHPDGSREVTTQHSGGNDEQPPPRHQLYVEERNDSSPGMRDTVPLFGLFSALKDIFTPR